MTVDVDPAAYFRSSSSAQFNGTTVGGALDILKTSLAGSLGMAGFDDTGKEFADGYDPTARDVLTSIAGLSHMTINAANLIRASGLNHQNAEHASTIGAPPPESVPVPQEPPPAVPTIPSAYGYGGNEPTGAIATAWYYIQKWVGYAWPDGDPDKLEAAARAWNTAATTIRNAGTALEWAKDDLAAQVSPEVPAAMDHLTDLKGKLDSVAGACNNIESSCNNLSQSIKDAHNELTSELAEFAAEFVVGEVIFGVLIEAGGEVWGNAAMAARAEIVAQRCERIIQKLIELAKTAARIAKAAGDAIAHIVTKIKSVIAALVTKVPGVEQEATRLGGIANQFHSLLDSVASRMRTTSVLSTREGTDIVASGGRDLSRAQRELATEQGLQVALSPKAHAEITALDKALAEGLTPRQIVASRPICPECQLEIIARGGTILPDGLGAVWP